MSNEQRKLLPYEHQLIDALGISKEEYLGFVAQQHLYKDFKEGSVLDARNDFAVVALILTIVGTLFQVAAILLAPKPDEGRGQPGSRDEVFAPRFGFNSLQELARYGDPVNLVYTNTSTNPEGGVRVATSLLWSAVQSYGNSQFIQLMLVIGAGGIGAIDAGRSGFGQLGIRDLIAQNYWLYFNPLGTGALRNRHALPAFAGELKTNDPSISKGDNAKVYRIRTRNDGKTEMVEGFSHAYSPSSANTFGIYGVVPINVKLFVRNENGDFTQASNKISMVEAGSDKSAWSGSLERIRKGEEFQIVLAKADESKIKEEELARKEAAESRQSLASVFDNSGIVKLGSSKLKIISANRGSVLEGDMIVSLQCTEGGRSSSVPYLNDEVTDLNVLSILGDEEEYVQARAISNSLLEQDARKVPTGRTIIRFSKTGIISRTPELRDLSATELADKGDLWTIPLLDFLSSFFRGSLQAPINRSLRALPNTLQFLRELTTSEIDALRTFVRLDAIKNATGRRDDYFFSKAVVRIEEASYDTISPCHIVDFSIKTRLFKRVSGRAEEYGSKRRKGWSTADNGTKSRSAMFLVKYKNSAQPNYSYVPGIFIARRAGDIDSYIFLRFNSGAEGIRSARNWQFIFEPIIDPHAESLAHPELKGLDENGAIIYYYLENSTNLKNLQRINLPNGPAFFEYAGQRKNAAIEAFPPINSSPKGMNEWDLFTNSSDSQVQFSFDNGPEFSLAVVTEQIIDPASNYSKLYEDLSLVGLNMYSGKSVQDLRSFTLFVTQGRQSRLLRTSGTINGVQWGGAGYEYLPPSANGHANTAPDIFIDTVLDPNDGIGQYASIHSVNLEQLARSKKFCLENNLFMDGVIAEPTSWREFWASNAGFSLLELAKIGGEDTLVPAVPYNKNTGAISPILPIVALFNQGNILEDSYKEEFIDYGSNTQDVIVTSIYRKLDPNDMFPLKASVDVQLADTRNSEDACLKETLDLSAFVTRRDQAILVGKFLCLSRRHSRRSIEFKTFPTDSPVFPGAYIYVEIAQNQWNSIYTGVVEDGGFLNTPSSPSIPNGNYEVLCYKTGGGTTPLSNIPVTNNRAANLSGYKDHLFVLGKKVKSKRVFKVTEVMMDEEGEVTIRGVEHATNDNGESQIAKGLLPSSNALFLIDGR